jgi:CheY-like chemotaxis protein
MAGTIKRVLLIDDDGDDAEIFADALKELPLLTAFDHFEDSIAALEQLRQQDILQPDIIFLDVNMPVMNGWECLRKIREIAFLQQIPVIIYSTSNIHSKGLTPTAVGAADFMTKPDTFRELKSKLEDLLGRLFQ